MKIIFTFWLLLLGGILGFAVSNAESADSTPIFCYDTRSQEEIGCDKLPSHPFSSHSAYDASSVLPTSEKETRQPGNDSILASVAHFLAAKSAGQLGREGEALASQITGAAKNTESWVVNGRVRIPDQVLAQDIVTRNPTIITEVKIVQYQSLTRQLRDYRDLVGPGGRVDVALPPGARVSGPLQQAFDNPLNPLNRIDLVPPR